MHITPQIPDGYDGPIKKLTCRVCKRIFYTTMTDYHQLGDISYCYECSLIVTEEVAKVKESQIKPAPQVSPDQAPPLVAVMPIAPHLSVRSPLSRPSVQVPHPRTLDREKMTIEQLLEEAKMLAKTWCYREALASYEQVLQRNPKSIARRLRIIMRSAVISFFSNVMLKRFAPLIVA